MFLQQPVKYLAVVLLLACCAWLPIEVEGDQLTGTSKKINLALRRTADRLLRISGDSTSRIPAIEQRNEHAWRIHVGETIGYDSLPYVLQSSLERYDIHRTYEVTIHRCEDNVIDLGYQQQDVLQDSVIPCGTRIEPDGCHYIEITFTGTLPVLPANQSKAWLYVLLPVLALGGLVLLYYRRRKGTLPATENASPGTGWILFGHSKLHINNQLIEIDGMRQSLTYREAKLLHLFASHPGQLLERDLILQQVWADEGVVVGRSLDMFVSRLRKKLKDDPTIGIVAVHGLGYKLETKVA